MILIFVLLAFKNITGEDAAGVSYSSF